MPLKGQPEMISGILLVFFFVVVVDTNSCSYFYYLNKSRKPRWLLLCMKITAILLI